MNLRQFKTLAIKLAPILLLAALLALIDYSVNAPKTNAVSSDMLPQVPAIINPVDAGVQSAEIIALYRQFNAPQAVEAELPPSSETEGVSGLTLAEQDLQQGRLRTLYINDNVYRLSAIIKQQYYMANLTVTDSKNPSAMPQRLLLKAGDKLQHYDVVAVSAKRITLRHQQRELWLQLFTAEAALPISSMP
ncbi:hypothetical protein [Rheinheimera metallidurans]|uniref:hypothetical protein n=1 Tax=Rheinheimera metallidurans TaxID=2925781 RepID=UPI003002DAC1